MKLVNKPTCSTHGFRTAKGLAIAAMLLTSQSRAATGDVVAYWDFSSDDKGEIDVNGTATSNYDLVNDGGVTIANGAAVFDGTARDFHTEKSIEFSAANAYTIECFVQADADCNGMVMELSANYTQNIGGFYILIPSSGLGETYVRGDGGYNGERFKSGTNIRGDGQWHHVALVVDPSGDSPSETVQLYLDGVRQANHVGNNAGSHLGAYQLYVGSRSGSQFPFKGKIDDIRITEGALAPENFMSASARTAGTHVRAFWKFDPENPLADSSGNGNALQGSRGVTFANGYASFDGTAGDVRTAQSLDLSDSVDATIECFVRMHHGANGGTAMVLEHSEHYWANQQCFQINVGEKGAASVLGTFRLADGYRAGYSPVKSIAVGWHHIALVKNSSAGTVTLYLDGAPQTAFAGSSTATGAALADKILYVGSRANSEFGLDGDIDDIRITAQALRPRQFLRTRTGELEDVIAYWPFDKNSMFADASGNGNTLTGTGVTSSEEWTAVFNGSQRGFATVLPLPLYPYDSLTVEWFMKADSSGSGATMVMEMSANYNNNPGSFAVTANESDAGNVSGGFRMGTGFNTLRGASALDGQWHHYALVFDASESGAEIVKLYRDREEITRRLGTWTGIPDLCSAVLYIGSRAGSTLPFVGELDDVKITGRALLPSEFMKGRSFPPCTVMVLR